VTRYQLVKLVALAGTLSSRKRLQKIVYLLQSAGCPFEAEYRLHFYGPYSEEVARLLGELVAQKLLEESCTLHGAGEQYSYSLSEGGAASLAAYEQTPEGAAAAEPLGPFEARFRRLLAADLGELELASTVAFYWRQGGNWEQAQRQAGLLKKVPLDSVRLSQACRLARSVMEQA
jgi:hypothetical protein